MATIFNEMEGSGGVTREPYARIEDWLKTLSRSDVERALREAEAIFRRQGITFAVYGDNQASERLIPFDIIPRIFAAAEWRKLSAGIEQRVRALNAFIHDLYHRQEILRAGRIPHEFIIQNEAFVPEMVGVMPARGIYAHIIGIDIVRVAENEFYVLEDNCRTPSGVSYMLEDREAMMYLFPDLFAQQRVAPVENYPAMLRQTLESVAPPACKGDPTVVILTPGIHNSAFFEHAFLADEMGVELCEGGDLFVEDGYLYMRTTQEPKRVDVVYRRIDDAFLDPLTFRPDTAIGVPGIFDLYRAGRVTLVNAPGTGIADDKAIYTYIPEVIEFYTGEKPLLKNVPTWRCSDPKQLAYVLEHLPELVVKEVHGSGGYGMLVGPTSSKKEIEAFRARLKARPKNYIAQPTLALSTVPTFTKSGVAPRHVDLRPFVLSGDKVRITPGGLTRVALKKGSLVVNSSQGGGTKDTWVLEDSMLGRTAASLYWMSRYMERAENMARLLEVGYRISLMPGAVEGHRDEWRSTLQSCACDIAYAEKHAEITSARVIDFLIFDEDNPSSIRASIKTARNNGRAVRTALTRDVWESMNSTWNELAQVKASSMTADRLPVFLEWVKQRVMSFRGALLGTMLRNDTYCFSQLGNFVERADNTARILDVKYFILLPRPSDVGSELDMQQWAQILRSVSGHRAYRWFYRDSNYRPWLVSEFLILREEMPRSLVFSYNWVNQALAGLASLYGKSYDCHEQARESHDRLRSANMEQIFQSGLHEFLQDFIADNTKLSMSIARNYNFP